MDCLVENMGREENLNLNPFNGVLAAGKSKRNDDMEVCQRQKKDLFDSMIRKFAELFNDDIEAASAAGKTSVELCFQIHAQRNWPLSLAAKNPRSTEKKTNLDEWTKIIATFESGSTTLRATSGEFWTLLAETLKQEGMHLQTQYFHWTPRFLSIQITWD